MVVPNDEDVIGEDRDARHRHRGKKRALPGALRPEHGPRPSVHHECSGVEALKTAPPGHDAGCGREVWMDDFAVSGQRRQVERRTVTASVDIHPTGGLRPNSCASIVEILVGPAFAQPTLDMPIDPARRARESANPTLPSDQAGRGRTHPAGRARRPDPGSDLIRSRQGASCSGHHATR